MWDQVIGHKREIDLLKKAIHSGNVPHAYLFSGVEGIGKKLVAYECASTLLGRNITESSEDPDIIKVEVEPDSREIKIEAIRELKEKLQFAPLKGDRRVIIIDNAELMNKNTANAALKILEEPPAGNHFFLITSALHTLIPTIISRCQKISFSPLTEKEVAGYLTNNKAYNDEDARVSAKMSEGSVAKATELNAETVEAISEEFLQLLNNRTATGILDLSAKWSARKDDMGTIILILQRAFHNALRISIAKEPARRETSLDCLTEVISRKFTADALTEKGRQIARCHDYIQRTYNKQLMFEQLLFNLTA